MIESQEALAKSITALWEGRDDLFSVLPEAEKRVGSKKKGKRKKGKKRERGKEEKKGRGGREEEKGKKREE